MLNTIVPIFSAGVAAGGDFESIATVTVGSGNAADITFSSIATDWTHLQIRAIARTTAIADLRIQFNGDTATNYAIHNLYGTGSAAFSDAATTRSFMQVLGFSGAPTAANTFAGIVIDLLDYKNTNKYKTLRSLDGSDSNGTGGIHLNSGLWQSTSAVNSIKIYPAGGHSFAQYTHFALYGIKSA